MSAAALRLKGRNLRLPACMHMVYTQLIAYNPAMCHAFTLPSGLVHRGSHDHRHAGMSLTCLGTAAKARLHTCWKDTEVLQADVCRMWDWQEMRYGCGSMKLCS